MIVLAIDGALGGFSAAVAQDGKALAVSDLPANVALEQGLSAIGDVLKRSGIDRAQIDRLAVGIGPGSFTGVRIAISYAKSLALGWKRPLTGVNSFDALEAGVGAAEPLLTVVRGRTGVVSVQYRAGGQARRASGYIKDAIAEIAPAPGPLSVLGDAEDVLSALAERGCSVQYLDRAIRPTALAVATVAAARDAAPSSHEIRADYGELPAAKVPRFGGAHGER